MSLETAAPLDLIPARINVLVFEQIAPLGLIPLLVSQLVGRERERDIG